MCYTGVDVGDTIPANLKRGGERKTERADRQTLECVAKLSHPLPADRKEGGFLLGGTLPARASNRTKPQQRALPVARTLTIADVTGRKMRRKTGYLRIAPPHLDNELASRGEVVEETLTVYGLLEDLNEEFDPGSG